VLAGWEAAGGKGWRYSDMAILSALSLRAVFGLTLCQTQGFLHDLTRRLGLAIEVPHYSTVSRRAAALPVPKLARPAGGGPLHLAIDATGLKVHGEAARTDAGSGASCTWPWTPGPARCTPMPRQRATPTTGASSKACSPPPTRRSPWSAPTRP